MIKNYYKLIVALLFATNVFGQNLPSYLPKDGLVGWWPFNGNAKDESGNGNHGTVNGATLTKDRNGKSNSAYSFDGIDDNIEIQVNQSLSFTYSTWVNFTNFNQINQTIIQHKSNCSRGGGLIFGIQNNQLRVIINNCGQCSTNSCPTEKSITNLYQFNPNQWYNLVISASETTNDFFVYVNGVQVYTFNSPISIQQYGIQPLSLGKFHDSPDLYYTNAQKDDIGFWNRALNEAEIQSLYTGTPITQNLPSYLPKDGLVGWWPFNGNANDESGNGNHGTVNGATLTTDRNGKDNKSYYFGDKYDVIRIKDNDKLDLKTEYSISAWVKTDENTYGNITNYGAMIGKWGDNEAAYLLSLSPNGNIYYCTRESSNTCITTTQNLNLNSWYLITITQRNNNVTVFLNDKKIGELNNISNPNNNFNDLIFGSNDAYNLNWVGDDFYGQLDDIAIYNRALSEAEIQALYTGTPLCTTPPTPKVNPTVTSCADNSISIEATGATGVETFNWYDAAEGGTPIATSQIFKTPVLNYGENKTYWVSITNGVCESTRARVDVVVKELPTVKKPENYSVCAGESIQTINFTVSPQGATNYWSNDNLAISLQKNGMGAIPSFKTPSNTNSPIVSNITVTPSFNGCVGKSETFKIYVIPTPKVAITNLKPIVYTSDAPIALEGEPAGGTFTGEAIVGTIFTPAKATLGKKSIEYKYVSKDGCGGIATASTIVVDTNGVVCTKYDTITVKETIYDTVLKITFKLTTGIKISKTTSLTVYPNPTADNLIIDAADVAAMSGYSYQLLDALGKEIYSQLVTSKKTEISLKTLGAKGVYVLHVLDANNQSVVSKKIVLE